MSNERHASKEWMRDNFTVKEVDELRQKSLYERFKAIDTRLVAIQQSMITPAAFFATIGSATGLIIAILTIIKFFA